MVTKNYGPEYEPPPGFELMSIHAGRGRPSKGSIGLVQAVAAASGYSERVVARALAGAPRAGSRRSVSSGCPICGHEPQSAEAPPPKNQDHHSLTAVGLTMVGTALPLRVDPIRETRLALVEALDAAIAMGALASDAADQARRLRMVLDAEEK